MAPRVPAARCKGRLGAHVRRTEPSSSGLEGFGVEGFAVTPSPGARGFEFWDSVIEVLSTMQWGGGAFDANDASEDLGGIGSRSEAWLNLVLRCPAAPQ